MDWSNFEWIQYIAQIICDQFVLLFLTRKPNAFWDMYLEFYQNFAPPGNHLEFGNIFIKFLFVSLVMKVFLYAVAVLVFEISPVATLDGTSVYLMTLVYPLSTIYATIRMEWYHMELVDKNENAITVTPNLFRPSLTLRLKRNLSVPQIFVF